MTGGLTPVKCTGSGLVSCEGPYGRRAGAGPATKGIWVRVTVCFRKLDGAWQIVHDQASVPFDVLSGRAVADLEP